MQYQITCNLSQIGNICLYDIKNESHEQMMLVMELLLHSKVKLKPKTMNNLDVHDVWRHQNVTIDLEPHKMLQLHFYY